MEAKMEEIELTLIVVIIVLAVTLANGFS